MDARRQAQAAAGLVLTGTGWLLRHYAHWNWLAALAAATAAALAAGVITRIILDTLPLPVPPGLAARVAELTRDGDWRVTRIHPWWDCALADEDRPHVHLVRARCGCKKIIREPGNTMS
jgi:hypothetical protein